MIYDRLGYQIVIGSLLMTPVSGAVMVVTSLNVDFDGPIMVTGIVIEGGNSWFIVCREGICARRIPGFIKDFEIVGWHRR
jgi:hypothetical protein